MTQELMVVFMIVAFVSGLLGVLGFTILNFRGERLAKFVSVVAAVAAAACWALGLLSQVPLPYVWVGVLFAASAYIGMKLDVWWCDVKAFVTRTYRARKT